MGTSNWQNISWCIQAIMKIAPRRVLDVGVGFGRWGMVIREFGEVWFDRVQPDDWSIYIEGIEAFAANIAPYHRHFYNRIHLGDANEILPTLDEKWDLIIFGDVLEHFDKGDGEVLLEIALERSEYVLVNIPVGDDWPQEDKYENPYEEHKAVWEIRDFPESIVRRQQLFLDFRERPFASLLLATKDTKRVEDGLFGSAQQGEQSPAFGEVALAAKDREALEQIGERIEALEAIRASGAWRWLSRVRNNRTLWSAASWIRRGGARVTCTFPAPPGDGGGIRIRRIESDGHAILWDFVGRDEGWELRPDPGGAFGQSLVAIAAGARCWWSEYGGEQRLSVVGAPGLGALHIDGSGGGQDVELGCAAPTLLRIDPARGALGGDPLAGLPSTTPAKLGPSERETLEGLEAQGRECLALHVPGWVGIANSTRTLFPVVHPVSAEIDRVERARLFCLLDEGRPENLILSGGAVDHLRLAPEIRKRHPKINIKVLWHGSTLQVREDYAWRGLRLSFDLARRGVVDVLGFVKEGMAEFAGDIGLSAKFVMNFVPMLPEGPSQPGAGGPHFGMWISNEGWRKPPFAMAAAVRRVPGGRLHISKANRRLQEFAGLIELPLEQHGERLLDWPQLARWMRQMHINLYVTLSECCPMLPLESLSVGTPCLVGPSSHLFRDDRYLFDRLVVPFPDSEASIYEKALQALAERDKIVATYRRWAIGYNEQARASVREFLEA